MPRKYVWWLLGLCLFAAANATAAVWNIHLLHQIGAQRTDLYSTLGEIKGLLLARESAETGPRIFLLTGKEADLDPYLVATSGEDRSVHAIFDRLRKLNNEASPQVDAIQKEVERRLAELDEILKLYRQGEHEKAIELLNRAGPQQEVLQAQINNLQTGQVAKLQQLSSSSNLCSLKIFLAVGLGALLTYAATSGLVYVDHRKRRWAARLLTHQRERWRQNNDRLRELGRAGLAIHAARSLDSLVTFVSETARRLVPAHQAATIVKTDGTWDDAVHHVSLSETQPLPTQEDRPDGKAIGDLVGPAKAPLRWTQAELESHPDGPKILRGRHPTLRGLLAVPLVAPNGDLLGFIELTDRVEGDFTPEDEGALVQLAQMAAVAFENMRLTNRVSEAGGQKDAFLAMLAHELRNPLAPLRNAIQLLRLQTDPETIGWARDVIERQVLHLSRMVDDLLDASRVGRGKIKLQRVPVELTNLVRLTVQDHRASLEAAGLALKLDVSAEPIWVHGDPVRLAQVLTNLLHNAAKFTEAGGQITLQLTPEDGWARLGVADTGSGIEPKILPHIFESLTQADRSLERSKGGLGLGLALVKGLVDLHGGRVEAASGGAQRGTAITVLLPLGPTPESSPAPPESSQLAARRLRVLIIEDNADAAASLAALLGVYGHDTEVAYAGPDGVEAVARFKPDVVLCDLGLPGISGYEVARILRADPKNESLHLIAVSGYGQEEDHQAALLAGFDQALVKPVDPENLRHLLAEL